MWNTCLYVIYYIDPPPRFPNIGYIGSTYDIFHGNPLSTKGLDPGFSLRNLYKFTYLDGSTTADFRYSLPDHVQAKPSQTCSFEFSSETIDDTASYFNSLKLNVGTDFKFFGASFSANADYKEVHESSSSAHSTYVSSHCTCESYITNVEYHTATLNPAFVKAVHELPSQPDEFNDYIDFLRYWGTHAITSLTMGGRYGIRSSVSKLDYATMASTGLDIKASAGYSGLLSINTEAYGGVEKDQAEQFENSRKDYELYQIGGKPPLSSDPNSTEAWVMTVSDNPLPLSYSMIPLKFFFTSDYFPSDHDISIKQAILENATTDYCLSLELADSSFCTSDGPKSSPKIGVTFSKSYTDLTCSDFHGNFVTQNVHNPSHRIFGTLKRKSKIDSSPIVLINGDKAPKELIREATEWKKVFYTWDTKAIILTPVCDANFIHVTDFYCCGVEESECFAKAPKLLPCISMDCIVECGYINCFDENELEPVVEVGFGSNIFGNDCKYNYMFTNHVPFKFGIYPLFDMTPCLNSKCFSFT